MSQTVGRLCSFAFDQYNLHRIQACVLPTNTRSTGVLRHAGFDQEGRLRSYSVKSGQPVDDLILGLLNISD